MDTTVLLEKLIDIERFIGVEPDAEIRRKVIDIEDYILTVREGSLENRRPKQASGDKRRVWKVEISANSRATAPYLVWSKRATVCRFPWPADAPEGEPRRPTRCSRQD